MSLKDRQHPAPSEGQFTTMDSTPPYRKFIPRSKFRVAMLAVIAANRIMTSPDFERQNSFSSRSSLDYYEMFREQPPSGTSSSPPLSPRSRFRAAQYAIIAANRLMHSVNDQLFSESGEGTRRGTSRKQKGHVSRFFGLIQKRPSLRFGKRTDSAVDEDTNLGNESRNDRPVETNTQQEPETRVTSQSGDTQGKLVALYNQHIQRSPPVNWQTLHSVLQADDSQLDFRDILFAHKLAAYLMHMRADSSDIFRNEDDLRIFVAEKLYGPLINLSYITEGHQLIISIMLEQARKQGLLSTDGFISLFHILRLKKHVDYRFARLTAVLEEIYRNFSGRLTLLETQLPYVQRSLQQVKDSLENGRRVAMWVALVKFGLSIIPIAGQIATAAVDLVSQGAEFVIDSALSEVPSEILGTVQELLNETTSFALDVAVLQTGEDSPERKEEVAAANLGKVAISKEFRALLCPEDRAKFEEAISEVWDSPVEELEMLIGIIFRDSTLSVGPQVFELNCREDSPRSVSTGTSIPKRSSTTTQQSNDALIVHDRAVLMIEEAFKEYELARLPRFFIQKTLLDMARNPPYKINKSQLSFAIEKVRKAISESSDSTWQARFMEAMDPSTGLANAALVCRIVRDLNGAPNLEDTDLTGVVMSNSVNGMLDLAQFLDVCRRLWLPKAMPQAVSV